MAEKKKDQAEKGEPLPVNREVKTQFPIARIKRLMQSDEDIGKVASLTPVSVAKALELFMIQVVEEACKRARAKQVKRVSIAHLYQAIMEEEQFDFLRDVMEKYEAQATEPRKRKSESQ